jgi:DNA-binding response OmpR family regulator
MAEKLILVVDDEKNILFILERYLQKAGYRVLKAESGEEGVVLVKNSKPDLVLMDVMLPDMTGAEAVKEIISDSRLNTVPIIFLTGMITKGEEIKDHLSLKIDGRSFETLAKPIDQTELLSKIKELLDKYLR